MTSTADTIRTYSNAWRAGAEAGIRRRPDGSLFLLRNEQGGVRCETPDDRPQIGDVVTCIVPHCDPTVNLYEVLHIVEGDTLVAIWPIEARGLST